MKKLFRWIVRVISAIAVILVLIVISGYVYEHVTRYHIRKSMPVCGRLVDIGDHRLHINIKGTGGPLVVFEAGFDGAGSLVWDKVQNEVSRFNATASYDRAGILFSERGKNPKTAEAMAVELHALLTGAGQEGPFILVGHSAAGLTLRSFVEKYPGEAAGVVFVDVSHPEQFERMKEVFGDMAFNESPSWIKWFANETGIIRYQARNLSFIGTSADDSINIITKKLFPVSFAAIEEESRNAQKIAEEVSHIDSFGSIPLIVITGTGESRRASFPTEEMADNFEKIWIELHRDLLDLSENSEHILAGESGHYVQLEQPGIVVEAIRKVIENVSVPN